MSDLLPGHRVLLVFALPVLALTGLYAAAPQRAASMLGALQAWMAKHSRTITVVICFVFGAFFLIRGLMGAWDQRRQVGAAKTIV